MLALRGQLRALGWGQHFRAARTTSVPGCTGDAAKVAEALSATSPVTARCTLTAFSRVEREFLARHAAHATGHARQRARFLASSFANIRGCRGKVRDWSTDVSNDRPWQRPDTATHFSPTALRAPLAVALKGLSNRRASLPYPYLGDLCSANLAALRMALARGAPPRPGLPLQGHWFQVPAVRSTVLKAHISSAQFQETGSRQYSVVYEIDVQCGAHVWTVHRRFSEFAALHAVLRRNLGCDVPTAAIFSMSHEFGPLCGAVRKFQPALMEGRLTALSAWLEQLCATAQFSLHLGDFLCVGSPNVDAYRIKRGREGPKPCALCSVGAPCEFTEEVNAAQRSSALAVPMTAPLCRSERLSSSSIDSPDTVMDTSPPSPSEANALHQCVANEAETCVPLSEVAMFNTPSFSYDSTAATLAIELCRLHGATPLPPPHDPFRTASRLWT